MPILLTTLSEFRSIPWIDGVVRAIINVIVSVYELYIRHAGIENLVSVTAITDFKFDVLPVVHDFVAYCKASVIAYAMNNETILCAGQDIFDGMLGSKETDAENCSCVSVSDKEFARLHSKYNLKKEDVLEVIKAYAQELGLEYGPVNYFMMCDPKYANDLGEVVQ